MKEIQATLLIVDDEKTFVETLAYNLRREGYVVLVAADGPTAVRLALQENPDLIILDVMLPGMNGFDVCRAVRRERKMPILMLSARADEIDKVVGLELGADDYLTKPFGLRELLARVRAMLRRVEMSEGGLSPDQVPGEGEPGLEDGLNLAGGEASSPNTPPYTAGHPGYQGGTGGFPSIIAGDLLIDIGGRRVLRKDQLIPLKPKEFDLLVFLAQNPGQVFSRDILLNRVWGYDFVGGTRTVDVHVRWLRSKLEHDAADPQIIQTAHGVGYKFSLPVSLKGL